MPTSSDFILLLKHHHASSLLPLSALIHTNPVNMHISWVIIRYLSVILDRVGAFHQILQVYPNHVVCRKKLSRSEVEKHRLLYVIQQRKKKKKISHKQHALEIQYYLISCCIRSHNCFLTEVKPLKNYSEANPQLSNLEHQPVICNNSK